MDFYEVVRKRRSIRKFSDEMVEDEVLKRILNAARLAPTWANMQGVRFIVVKDPERVQRVRDAVGQKWMKYCNMFIVVTVKPQQSGQNGDLKYFPVDAAICMEHLILAAAAEGLGTCWIGHFNEKKLQETLEIPKRSRIIALTPVGYSVYSPRPQDRKPLDEIVFLNKYGEKWS